MTDRELLEQILCTVTETKNDVKELNRKMDIVYEQTAGLTEFQISISKNIGRHELDIQILKKLAAK